MNYSSTVSSGKKKKVGKKRKKVNWHQHSKLIKSSSSRRGIKNRKGKKNTERELNELLLHPVHILLVWNILYSELDAAVREIDMILAQLPPCALPPYWGSFPAMTNPATRSTPIKKKTKIANTICESDAAICWLGCCSVRGVELFPVHWKKKEGGKVGGFLFPFLFSYFSLHFTRRSDGDDGMMVMKRCCQRRLLSPCEICRGLSC